MSVKKCNLSEIKELDSSIKILGEGLKKVHKDYIEIAYQNVGKNSQKPERVFVAELYHQLRILQGENKYKSLNNLRFNVEITKQGNLKDIDSLIDQYKIKRVIPDIVLHHSQNKRDTQNQLLACEVKSSYYITKSNFERDLIKLLLYKSNRFNYQYACFIFLGTKEELCKYLLGLGDLLRGRLANSSIKFITYETKSWSFYEYK
jgi:hypothetical protein